MFNYDLGGNSPHDHVTAEVRVELADFLVDLLQPLGGEELALVLDGRGEHGRGRAGRSQPAGQHRRHQHPTPAHRHGGGPPRKAGRPVNATPLS